MTSPKVGVFRNSISIPAGVFISPPDNLSQQFPVFLEVISVLSSGPQFGRLIWPHLM
jgi:hypothetical protein